MINIKYYNHLFDIEYLYSHHTSVLTIESTNINQDEIMNIIQSNKNIVIYFSSSTILLLQSLLSVYNEFHTETPIDNFTNLDPIF